MRNIPKSLILTIAELKKENYKKVVDLVFELAHEEVKERYQKKFEEIEERYKK